MIFQGVFMHHFMTFFNEINDRYLLLRNPANNNAWQKKKKKRKKENRKKDTHIKIAEKSFVGLYIYQDSSLNHYTADSMPIPL